MSRRVVLFRACDRALLHFKFSFFEVMQISAQLQHLADFPVSKHKTETCAKFFFLLSPVFPTIPFLAWIIWDGDSVTDALCFPRKPQETRWPLAHRWHQRGSAHTFLLGDEANQDADGVFVRVVRYVGTAVTCGEHKRAETWLKEKMPTAPFWFWGVQFSKVAFFFSSI